MRHRDFRRRRSLVQPFTRTVDAVTGAAMLIRREVIDRIGLFREEYFFGFEGLDYCLRARQAGFLTARVGRASVLHEGNLSIGRTSQLRVYYATRNHLLIASRFGAGLRASRWIRTGSVLVLNLALVATTRDLPRRSGLSGFAAGVRDYFARRFGHADEEGART